MTQHSPTIDSLTAEAFGLISTAQRNGMSASDSVSAGIRPFLEELLSIREELAGMRTTDAIQDRQALLENNAALESQLAASYAMEHEYREVRDALKAAGLRTVRVGTVLVVIGDLTRE